MCDRPAHLTACLCVGSVFCQDEMVFKWAFNGLESVRTTKRWILVNLTTFEGNDLLWVFREHSSRNKEPTGQQLKSVLPVCLSVHCIYAFWSWHVVACWRNICMEHLWSFFRHLATGPMPIHKPNFLASQSSMHVSFWFDSLWLGASAQHDRGSHVHYNRTTDLWACL